MAWHYVTFKTTLSLTDLFQTFKTFELGCLFSDDHAVETTFEIRHLLIFMHEYTLSYLNLTSWCTFHSQLNTLWNSITIIVLVDSFCWAGVHSFCGREGERGMGGGKWHHALYITDDCGTPHYLWSMWQ